MKKPKWSISGPKVNGPDVDLDAGVSTPDLNLSAPNMDGEINAPDVDLNLPKAELEAPKFDVESPDVDIEAPSGKFKWFQFKKPKFGTLKGPKADIDSNVTIPEVDLKKADAEISAPDVNLSASNIDANVSGPDLNLGGPDLDLDAPDAKVKFPKFKFPKLKGSQVQGPSVDADLKTPHIDASLDTPKAEVNAPSANLRAEPLSLSAPKVNGGLDTPDLDVNLPKADLKGPSVDIQAPEADAHAGKIKLPQIKWPKFGTSAPKVKGPNLDVDADLQRPDLGLSVPDVNAKLPNADLTAPNVELKASDLSLSAPKLEGDIGTPGIDAGLKTGIDPNVNVGLPETDIKAPSLHLPKADLQSSDLSLKTPNVNLYPPKIGGSLSAPNIDTSMPKIELEAPNANVKSPGLDVNLPEADLKDSNIQLKTPDLDLNTHLGDFKMPHYNHPKLDLSSPEVEAPSINPTVEAGIKVPGVSTDMPTTDAHISVPAVDLNAPNVGDIKGPDVDVKAPDVDASLEKPKMPHFKIPKFSLFGSKAKSPETNASADLEGSGSDSDVGEVEVPVFKFHRLPQINIDGIGGITEALSSIKSDLEEKDFVFSKGIRLPVVNATAKEGEKIDILERLKIAREKASSVNVSPTEEKTDIDLQHTGAGLDANTSTGAGDASLVRGGTFKVDKPESTLGLTVPDISTSDENDKYALSLSNMLGLNVKDSDAN
ncbi:neuroblast differentiation-associated protein AHNAK [Haplochromis burtoni]|uniref:neuroblast differentiation-associated protein AHNAK n=1 Tax=Haplochromis burtoni TaxID=8153 RepID=UPI0006C9D03C|nr:neuroblast differentiation-associated protein AHNAK [Haplochromis burtoni]